jgi:translocation and assembly module TamB
VARHRPSQSRCCSNDPDGAPFQPKIAGISQLSINPVLSGSSSQGPPGANITIQQRVTGNLFVTFSTNVASTQSQTIQGQYQVSPRLALSATRDPNGGFAFDALIKKSW